MQWLTMLGGVASGTGIVLGARTLVNGWRRKLIADALHARLLSDLVITVGKLSDSLSDVKDRLTRAGF